MTKEIIIIALLIALIYYYRQSQTKPSFTSPDKIGGDELTQTKQANQTLVSFLRDSLNSNSLERSPDNLDKLLEELQTKLGEKTLDELLEENEDYETEIDTLTRTKNSLEADLLAQSNAFQNRLREKDREVKKFKEDLSSLEKRHQKQGELLTSEKQQHKGSLERITKLTEQITKLEKEKQTLSAQVEKMPGEFPEENKVELVKEHQEQLRQINLLFDEKAKDYAEIDFQGLYGLLKGIAEREREQNQK